MTDFNEPKPSAAATIEPAQRSAEPDGDPLAHLHKMSTTAGITSQEYVAINIPSIVALVLALASVVAVLNALLLVIPLAAVITAVVSLRQIRDSNGTQTGRGFAWLAIAVSLGIGGYKLVEAVTEHYQSKADRKVIIGQMEQLGRLVRAKDYDAAYNMFNSRFQNRIDRQTFESRWEAAQSYRDLGRITGLEWNRTNILFQYDQASATRVAFAAAWARFENGKEPARYTFDFRKSGSQWQIDDMPSMFPVERRPRRQ